jgi:hypothetical protein
LLQLPTAAALAGIARIMANAIVNIMPAAAKNNFMVLAVPWIPTVCAIFMDNAGWSAINQFNNKVWATSHIRSGTKRPEWHSADNRVASAVFRFWTKADNG